jgi:hypothetical protein
MCVASISEGIHHPGEFAGRLGNHAHLGEILKDTVTAFSVIIPVLQLRQPHYGNMSGDLFAVGGSLKHAVAKGSQLLLGPSRSPSCTVEDLQNFLRDRATRGAPSLAQLSVQVFNEATITTGCVQGIGIHLILFGFWMVQRTSFFRGSGGNKCLERQ